MSDEDKPVDAAAPVKPSRTVAVVILSTVMAVVLVVIVMMVMQRQPTAKGEDAPVGVEITVTSPRPGVPITIDGVKAGKTPQALKFKGRTRPITIRGNGVEKTVTPDRDQVVNLAP
jgi:hypothetical protein